MKNCELCGRPARAFCESDEASLCWDCDAKVHGANFLVARHSRTLLCHACHSPTPWKASGAKLGHTVSVCQLCIDNRRSRSEEESEGVTDDDDDDDDDNEGDGGGINEEGENQVVPWSSTPPPQPASSSSSDDTSNGLYGGDKQASDTVPIFPSKRMRDNASDLRPRPQEGLIFSSSQKQRVDGGGVTSFDSTRPLRDRSTGLAKPF